jgi:hypothetical protein
MADDFRIRNAWRLTAEQVRNAYPQAFEIEEVTGYRTL